MARSADQSAQRYPLTRILGTDAGLRVLRELSRHGGQLSAADLVRRARLAKSSVAHALAALEEMTIIAAAGSGRARLWRLRPEHPLAAPLNALFAAEEARFQAILDAAGDAAAQQDALALWAYGSTARGEDRPDSDLDLAAVFKPGSGPPVQGQALRDALAGPAERLGFHPSVVALETGDILRLEAEGDPWWRHLVADAIVLHGERPEDLAARLDRSRSAQVRIR